MHKLYILLTLVVYCLIFWEARGDEPLCQYPNIQAYDTAVRVCDPKHDGASLHKQCHGAPNTFSAKITNDTVFVYGCSQEVRWKKRHDRDYQVYYEPVFLKDEDTYAYVTCGDSDPIYLVKPAKPGYARNGVSNKELKNVFIVMMDALSWEGIQRYMPHTLDVVNKASKDFDVTEFAKYSAVGTNSFPNKFRLFGEYTYIEEHNREKGMTFNHTWIWEYAKMQGYYTVYSESYCPDVEAQTQKDFNIEIFGAPPASIGHHEQPDVVLIEQMCANNRTFNGNCMERRWTNEYVKDYMTELFEDTAQIPIGERAPIFLYNNFADPHTDNQWGTAIADDNVAEYLTTLMKSPLMDNGIIIFLSDHGLHYGSYQGTSIFGFAENRHPFLYSITKKEEYKNVQKNNDKLVTPMDLHHLFLNTIGLPKLNEFVTYNPLTEEIPSDRTCEKAGIPSDFCICTYTDQKPNPNFKPCNHTLPDYLWYICENFYAHPDIFDWKYYLDEVLIPTAQKVGGRVEETECFATIHWCALGVSCPLNGTSNFSPEEYLYSLPNDVAASYCYNWPEIFNCNWGWLIRDYLAETERKHI